MHSQGPAGPGVFPDVAAAGAAQRSAWLGSGRSGQRARRLLAMVQS